MTKPPSGALETGMKQVSQQGESKIIYSRSDESDHSENEAIAGFIPPMTPRRKALRVFDDSDDFVDENIQSLEGKDSSDSDIVTGPTPRRKPFRILDDSNVNESDKSRSYRCESSDSDDDSSVIIRATPRKNPPRILDESDVIKSDKSRSYRCESSDSDDDSSVIIRATPRRNPPRILDDSDHVIKRFERISMADSISNDVKSLKSPSSDKETDVIEILSDDSTSSFEGSSRQKSWMERKCENLKSKTSYTKERNTLTRLPEVRMSFLSSLSDETYGLPLHPVAEDYVKNYSKKKADLALYLYQYYNFHIFEKKLPDIPLKWSSRLTSTAGRARMSLNKAVSLQWNFMIELSNVLLSGPAQLRDTLLHEMCHVATCEIDKLPRANHGPPWKAWAKKCRQVFPELPEVQVCHQYERIWKYVYICKCPKTKGTMTKIPTKKLDCQVCGQKLSLQK